MSGVATTGVWGALPYPFGSRQGGRQEPPLDEAGVLAEVVLLKAPDACVSTRGAINRDQIPEKCKRRPDAG